MHNLWVEKYRPATFDDIIDQSDSVAMLKSFVTAKSMPHIVLTGPPGTGKTSAAHVLVKTMFPPEILHDRVLELNASEERGIRTVRGKIKRFVSCSIPNVQGVPSLSIVILDEADALTDDSQFALRRVMEDNCKHSRFILICNYINKIITPLLSRCSVIHFNALQEKSVNTILANICKKEHVSDDVRNQIVCDGKDARFVINKLQKLVSGSDAKNREGVDWREVVSESDYNRLFLKIEDMLLDGYDIDHLIEDFVRWAFDQENVCDPIFLKQALVTCCNVANHGTPEIQLASLLLSFKSLM